jgi:hypothetical protein
MCHTYVRYRTDIDFDKICVFCDKYCVCNNKFVSIVIKIKCVNSSNIRIFVINLILL